MRRDAAEMRATLYDLLADLQSGDKAREERAILISRDIIREIAALGEVAPHDPVGEIAQIIRMNVYGRL